MKQMARLLVVVDYQKDFVDGSLGFPKALTIEPYILSQIDDFEKAKDDVIFTRDVHPKNYLSSIEGQHLPVGHCIEGTPGSEIFGKARARAEHHPIFEKNTFGSDKLFEYLRAHEYQEIVLMGIVSNICVLTNAVLAKTAQPNTKITVDTKGSASFDLNLEKEGYDILRNLHIEIK